MSLRRLITTTYVKAVFYTAVGISSTVLYNDRIQTGASPFAAYSYVVAFATVSPLYVLCRPLLVTNRLKLITHQDPIE